MTSYRLITMFVLACLLTSGGIAKAVRYSEHYANPSTNDDTSIVINLMTTKGWQLDADNRSRPGDPYTWLVFRKPNCSQPITVSILSAGDELKPIVEMAHNNDVRYVQNDWAANSLSKMFHRLRKSVDTFADHAFEHAIGRIPLLAITPARIENPTDCPLPFESYPSRPLSASGTMLKSQ